MAAEISQALKGLFDQQTQQEVSKHVGEEWRSGFENLPPGIRGGIAKLKNIEIKFYDAKSQKKKADGSSAVGERYAMLTGVVMFPHEHIMGDGSKFPLYQKQTRIQIPLFDVKWGQRIKTKREGINEFLDELKKLANNRLLFGDGKKLISEEEIAQRIGQLLEKANGPKPTYFRFNTTAGKKEGSSFEEWTGSAGLENYVPTKPGRVGVQDDNKPTATVTQPTAAPTQQAQTTPPPMSVQDQARTSEDADFLVGLCNGDASHKETALAQNRLQELALRKGHTQEAVGAAPSWEAVGDMVKTAPAHANGQANGAAAWPQIEDLVRFTKAPLINPQTKQPMPGKFRKVEAVVKVKNDNNTLDLLDFNDGVTPYNAVPLADLEAV